MTKPVRKLKIAIVVHGRFDAFDLVKALMARGHDVTLFTNYPKWAVRKFGIPNQVVRSCWPHGILSRLILWCHEKLKWFYPEAFLHIWFGRWVASNVIKGSWDIVESWSGVSEEILKASLGPKTLKILIRGSSHILTQNKLLCDEEVRVGVKLDRPSSWMIARELREYDLASRIRVLSSFAYESFLAEGIPKDKLLLIPSGTPKVRFRPKNATIEDRCRRIFNKDPLRLLFVGTVCFRKGFMDLMAIACELKKNPNFKIRIAGPIAKEANAVLKKIASFTEIVGKIPEAQLPHHYAWADLFIFPTIEDGYPQVLAQATASGLPILTTPNCAGPDFIKEGINGWILPVRSPEAFVEKILWLDNHRPELARMTKWISEHHFLPRSWEDVVLDFEQQLISRL